jgi:hypothetical protein
MIKLTIKTHSFPTLYRFHQWPEPIDASWTRHQSLGQRKQATLPKVTFVHPKYIAARYGVMQDGWAIESPYGCRLEDTSA